MNKIIGSGLKTHLKPSKDLRDQSWSRDQFYVVLILILVPDNLVLVLILILMILFSEIYSRPALESVPENKKCEAALEEQ